MASSFIMALCMVSTLDGFAIQILGSKFHFLVPFWDFWVCGILMGVGTWMLT